MQVGHCHIVIFERPRQKSVHERGLRRRQPTIDADRGRLFRTAFGCEPNSKGSGGVEIRCRKTAADRIEKMLPRYRDHRSRQSVYAEFVNKPRDRAAQILFRFSWGGRHHRMPSIR